MPGAPPSPRASGVAVGPAPGAPPGASTAKPPPPACEPTTTATALPVIDLAPLLDGDPWPAADAGTAPEAVTSACAAIAASLVETGAVLVRDARASAADAAAFLDMLETYFAQPAADKAGDVRPDLHYQVGATPEGIEEPACLRSPRKQQEAAALAHVPPSDQPHWPTGADPKWRFFWRLGDRPAETAYPELNAPPVIPPAFADRWASVLDGWGGKLLDTLETVARAAGVGLGLDSSSLASLLHHGPHLLAPTGSDLSKHRAPGTVLAGYHADLNLLTIHSRGRLPGLFVWTRAGARLPVAIPPGCLLLQAGLQLEHVTGGAVAAGRHEVVVTPEALAAVDAAAAAGEPPGRAWRVSSTVFGHAASDAVLQPLGHFADRPGAIDAYPPIDAGAFVQKELEEIRLKVGRAGATPRASADGGKGAFA